MANGTTIQLTKEAVEQYFYGCTYEEILELLFSCFKISSKGGFNPKKSSSMIVLQQKMLEAQIHKACPHCGSVDYVRCGKQASGLICFKCKICGKKSNVLTGTILEKTHWQWELWVKVLEMTINNISVRDMVNILEQDYGCAGISFKTIWQWRMKLIHAFALMPQPKLTGVIQIDETYVRESQKGSRCLTSFLPDKNTIRLPRYGYMPSLLGTMGPEFCTVITAVDSRGYCAGGIIGMGKVSAELFFDSFDSLIDDPTYICTDGIPCTKPIVKLRTISITLCRQTIVKALKITVMLPFLRFQEQI